MERSEIGLAVIGIFNLSTNHLRPFKQGYSDDSSVKIKDHTITPQSLVNSPPRQTRDQVTQCIDESVYLLQSCLAEPFFPTAESFNK